MKWEGLQGKAILDRRKRLIYSKLVIPLGQAEQIAISQKYHRRAQKKLKKTIKILRKARQDIENMPLSDNEGVELISEEIKAVQSLSEELKKYYYNRLPYVELDDIGKKE